MAVNMGARQYSLRTKLSTAFLLVTLLLFSLVSALANFFLEKQFKEYVINKQEQKNKDVVALVAKRYNDWGDKWDKSGIENIGISILGEGLILKVKDEAGNPVWDATVHNNGICTAMLSQMANNMQRRYPNFKGGYEEKKYPVISGFSEVGSVEIGYYGPFYFSDNDLQFITTLNKLLFGAAVVSMLLSLILGAFMARRFSNPIARVIDTARQISKGNFEDRVHEKSNTKEISELTTTINSLAETLGKQEALRKRLTADVAHELRTPVATLQSHLEAMLDGIWKPDAKRLKSCHEETIRISKMVGGLEKLARYESENLVLDRSSFDVTKLLRRIVTNFESEFKHKNIEINLEGSEQYIYADMDKISQVFVNLISNALKYTAEGGITNIRVTGDKDNVTVIVRDTGIGINEEDLPNIFQRFYRADKSRNRLTGGSGIGLAIVKILVDAHEGLINVRSQVDKGSEFIVTLPRRMS